MNNWFDARHSLRQDFLTRNGLCDAVLTHIGEDSAFRRYFRISGTGKILMEAVPDGHANATPGHAIGDFIRIGAWMRSHRLHAPEVYAENAAEGYVLLQDFGDLSFRRAVEQGAARGDLYTAATDVLTRIRQIGPPDIALPDYYATHVHIGRRRLVDWYMPAVTGRRLENGVVESYLAVWDAIERGLPPCPQGFLHGDFHFENLMLLPSPSPHRGEGRDEGVSSSAPYPDTSPHPDPLPRGERERKQTGILDFQGAMHGPLPYDLANLLEDARVDVPDDVRTAMLDRYCAGMTAVERENFLNWYRVLATQFHCRVIGQFLRLALRDGKPRYLDYIPLVAHHIRRGLADPLLHPLAAWCGEMGLDFTKADGFDLDRIRPLISPEAF